MSIVGASIIPFAITPLIVSCSKKGEDLSNVKMYDKNYGIYFYGDGYITSYDGNAIELEIPEYLENNSDPSSPYYRKRIQIKKINSHAFKWSNEDDSGRPNLQKVILPNSITEIEMDAFSYNKQLIQVTIPNSVTKIGIYAFSDTQLIQVTIPYSVTYIGDLAFSNTQLTQVTYHQIVNTIHLLFLKNVM